MVSGADSDNDGIDDLYDVDVTGGTDADGDGVDDAIEALGTTDTDGDGIADALDVDSDNDGIPDAIEGSTDTDGDGTPDYLDLDSDNDGIPDSVEAPVSGTDTDGDGIDDLYDVDVTGGVDANNDGIDDATVNVLDSDGDSAPDYVDVDSDADGIPDNVEAGANAATPTDTDGDGTPDYQEQDSDSDGIPDNVEAGANAATPTDTDGDGTPDYQEQDSDSDGIPDTVEAGGDASNPVDTDNDGTPDFQELDSDNDGVTDDLEAGGNPSAPTDTDGDGIPDFQEPASDSDGDGLPDSIEGTVDTDGDGVADYLDADSDDDGIPDAIEADFEGEIPADKDEDGIFDYIDVDTDNDGISDAFEGFDDTDGDGVRDFRDLDVDNDGILDIIEARIGMVRVNELDTDLDGVIDLTYTYGPNGMADTVETVAESGNENYELPDIDSDGVLDYRDLDSDNDGILDTLESDHIDINLDGIIDTAEEGVLQNDRATLAVSSETGLAEGAGGAPRNTDGDGLADFRDGDSDNDGLTDVVESFGISQDADGDGRLDDFADNDGDGVDDTTQSLAIAPADTDRDGSYDAIEIDADADGITDLVEAGGVDADGNGVIDSFLDDDVDGIDDGVQAIPLALVDTDNDSSPDFQDLDSDNDGLSDIIESGGTDANGDGVADTLVIAAALPDENGDGIPDFQQILAQEPNLQAANGEIRTGLEGSGCSVGNTNGANDPLLLGLLALALLGVTRRYHNKQLLLLLPIVGFTTGCTLLPDTVPPKSPVIVSNDHMDSDWVYEDRLTRSVYAGVGVGLSRLEPDTSEVTGWDPNDRVNNGGQINLGIDLTKHLSAEVHSADLGSAGLSPDGRINYHINGASALLYAGGARHRFKRRGLVAYGRVGYGALHNSPVGEVPFTKVNANHILFGAGLEYNTRIGIGARAEIISFDRDVQYGQVGVIYRIGERRDPVPVARAPDPDVEPVLAAAKEPVMLPPVAPKQQPVARVIAPPPPVLKPDPCKRYTGLLEGVTFHTDSATLTTHATGVLDIVALTLKRCEMVPVTVSAHTDSVGSNAYNQALSEKRAQSVVDYLSSRGVGRDRLTPLAFGESAPIATNETAAGRKRNRRVEVISRY
jgi:MYXO-CTERM domain-containing protein